MASNHEDHAFPVADEKNTFVSREGDELPDAMQGVEQF